MTAFGLCWAVPLRLPETDRDKVPHFKAIRDPVTQDQQQLGAITLSTTRKSDAKAFHPHACRELARPKQPHARPTCRQEKGYVTTPTAQNPHIDSRSPVALNPFYMCIAKKSQILMLQNLASEEGDEKLMIAPNQYVVLCINDRTTRHVFFSEKRENKYENIQLS
jgi:hypothetical protein